MVQAHREHLHKVKAKHGGYVPHGYAVITMGLAGSGKSTYLQNHHMRHGGFLHLDPDEFKNSTRSITQIA